MHNLNAREPRWRLDAQCWRFPNSPSGEGPDSSTFIEPLRRFWLWPVEILHLSHGSDNRLLILLVPPAIQIALIAHAMTSSSMCRARSPDTTIVRSLKVRRTIEHTGYFVMVADGSSEARPARRSRSERRSSHLNYYGDKIFVGDILSGPPRSIVDGRRISAVSGFPVLLQRWKTAYWQQIAELLQSVLFLR